KRREKPGCHLYQVKAGLSRSPAAPTIADSDRARRAVRHGLGRRRRWLRIKSVMARAWRRRQSLIPIARSARFVMGSADAAVYRAKKEGKNRVVIYIK
ncbi:MAG: hypothetical protein PHR93_10240, partial [Acidobacteriota bacterium]|nr:hypothetical protein [Acidobacteriota bacterium]